MLTAEAALQNLQSQNKPLINELDREIYTSQPDLYIFNVYTEPLKIDLSFTSFNIPACPEGQQVSAPCVVKGMYHDYAQGQGDKFTLHAVPVLGLAAVKDAFLQHNLAEFGCFWTRNEKPTQQEIKAAREAVRPKLLAKVNRANKNSHGTQDQQNSIDESDRKAAAFLNIDAAWARETPELHRCQGCQATYKPGVAFCPNGCILDEALARKMRPFLFTDKKAS